MIDLAKPPVPPIVILGMHRSGTSATCKLLEALGVFVGSDLEGNHESKFFLRTNDRVLHRAGASWADPAPIMIALADPQQRERMVKELRRAVASGAARQ